MKTSFSRRQFLTRSTQAAAGLTFAPWISRAADPASPNDKLNLGIIGVAGQGEYNLNNVASQNIAALCDVDETRLAKAAQRFPAAKTYRDFRRLIDQPGLDAIVVATPDHTHAVCAAAALQTGRHVYCEKPLTRTVSECRRIEELAREKKRVTQMGTQIHAGNNYRRVVELIRSGVIGPIREVHVWVTGGFGNRERPQKTPPVPPGLDYDLWLGPVPTRPYSPEYVPFNWRNYWAFGGGTLADLGCHHQDLAFWALDLRVPRTVEATFGPPPHAESPPHYLTVRYEYAARGDQPPVTLWWRHGADNKPPPLADGRAPKWGGGNLFVGEKGMLIADYDRHQLLPADDFKDFKRPQPFIPNSIGHHAEWIAACKSGGPTTCNFDYAGALTESVLLGNVAFQTGKKLEWDTVALKAKNCPEADEYLQHHYREGWSL